MGNQAARNLVQSWTSPPKQALNPGQAIHHWHYPFVREALAVEPAIPWPEMEIGSGETELSVALFGLWEAEASKGFAAGPGWIRVPMRGFRPSDYWAKNVQLWEQRGTERLGPVESRYACPGVVLPAENPPPWFDIRKPAPTRDEVWAVWGAKLSASDYKLLADVLPGEPLTPPVDPPTEPPIDPPEPEPVDPYVLKLQGGRFEVTVNYETADGERGKGKAVSLVPVLGNDGSGLFWFFSDDNAELLVKVLDWRPFNGHWGVSFASTSDVRFLLEVHDTKTDARRAFLNRPGEFASVQNMDSFEEPTP